MWKLKEKKWECVGEVVDPNAGAASSTQTETDAVSACDLISLRDRLCYSLVMLSRTHLSKMN